MAIRNALCELGRVLDNWEAEGESIEELRLINCTSSTSGRSVTADVELTVPVGSLGGAQSNPTLSSPSVGPDGRLQGAITLSEPVIPANDSDLTVEPTEMSFDSDGTVTVGLSIAVSPPTKDEPVEATRPSNSEGVGDERSDRPDGPDGSDRSQRGDSADDVADGYDDASSGTATADVPPFEDRELLRGLYESCDTFAEMAEQIEMDVTAETVRRYMVDHDIHQPNSYDTGETEESTDSESDGEMRPTVRTDRSAAGTDRSVAGNGRSAAGNDGTESVVLSDGIGLPESVTVDKLIETIRTSNTIYEVERDVDVDHDGALDMLQELNLLDLVVGRLATEGERNVSRDEIVDRLRSASAVERHRQ